MTRQPAYLRKLHISRVDRVADPANPDAKVALFKSNDDAPLASRVSALMKSNAGLSRSQAVARILSDHPSLYEQQAPQPVEKADDVPTLRRAIETYIADTAHAQQRSVADVLTNDPVCKALYAYTTFPAASLPATEGAQQLAKSLGSSAEAVLKSAGL